MESSQIFLPLKFNQILDLIKQLTAKEKESLLKVLLKENNAQDDLVLTHFASEKTLSKDWLTETDDRAWQNL